MEKFIALLSQTNRSLFYYDTTGYGTKAVRGMNIFNEMRFIYSLTLNSRSVIRSVILSGRFERSGGSSETVALTGSRFWCKKSKWCGRIASSVGCCAGSNYHTLTHRNFIIIGPTGVGKSWLACAFGIRCLP
jgi:hypothetical protein